MDFDLTNRDWHQFWQSSEAVNHAAANALKYWLDYDALVWGVGQQTGFIWNILTPLNNGYYTVGGYPLLEHSVFALYDVAVSIVDRENCYDPFRNTIGRYDSVQYYNTGYTFVMWVLVVSAEDNSYLLRTDNRRNEEIYSGVLPRPPMNFQSLSLVFQGDGLYASYKATNTSAPISRKIAAKSLVADKNWHHIAWVIDSDGYWRALVDGVVTLTNAYVAVPGNAPRPLKVLGSSKIGTQSVLDAEPFWLIRPSSFYEDWIDSYSGMFQGYVDNFRQYHRALTDQEISMIKNADPHVDVNIRTISPTAAPTLASISNLYYHLTFDDDNGDEINRAPDGPQGVVGYRNSPLEDGALTMMRLSSDYVIQHMSLDQCEFQSSAVTFAMWFRSSSTLNFGRLFDFGNGSPQGNVLIQFYKDFLALYMFDSVGRGDHVDAHSQYAPYGHVLVNDNIWRHLIWVINGSTWSLYINGVKAMADYTSYLTLESGPRSHCYLGRSNWESDPGFSGQIDEFRMYQKALSAYEADTLFKYYTTGWLGMSVPQNSRVNLPVPVDPYVWGALAHLYTFNDG
jgi:hypothetical protein